MWRVPRVWPAAVALAALALVAGGCTSPLEYVRNGFKVGPNYQPAPAPVAAHWIDASDAQVHSVSPDLARWWGVFNDPALNRLVDCAFRQNLTLRQAGFRVLEARLQLAIAQGGLFPQTQTADGGYHRVGAGAGSGAGILGGLRLFLDQWNFGFNLAWELDFWGRLRRAIAAGQDNLDASVANYDQAVVTMLGDIAQNYVKSAPTRNEILLLRNSVAVQQGVVNYIQARFNRRLPPNANWTWIRPSATSGRPRPKSRRWRSTSARPPTASAPCWAFRRPTCNTCLGTGPIPNVPPEVAVGIPAELLRRRPDVRRAERLAAAQAEQIGIAEAQLYPTFSITGVIELAGRQLQRPLHQQCLQTAASGRSSSGTSSTTAASATTSSTRTPC